MSPAAHPSPALLPPQGLRAFVAPALVLVLVLVAGAALASLADAPAAREPHAEDGGLHVFRLRAGVVAQLTDGAAANAGDCVQLAYDARARHGVIWSVDSRGARSLHFPSTRCDSTALGDARGKPLPFSWELDDAPGDERFYFVTSPQPLDPGRLMATHPGRPTFTLHKGAPDRSIPQLTTPRAPSLR